MEILDFCGGQNKFRVLPSSTDIISKFVPKP